LHDGSDGIAALTVKFASNERLRIASSGKVGISVIDPKSFLHVNGPGDIRLGSADSGSSQIQLQKEYSSGTTGTHWMFNTVGSISWCFDGVLVVHGGGGSGYGSEVTHIKIVYSRESGAINSGDIWRNGTTRYNIETLGHDQCGLNPSAGSLSWSEQTDPDGAASTRALFKLAWSASGQSVSCWSKLIGTMYWARPMSGTSVEIQDSGGTVHFDSAP
jgi:hypothetical protein